MESNIVHQFVTGSTSHQWLSRRWYNREVWRYLGRPFRCCSGLLKSRNNECVCRFSSSHTVVEERRDQGVCPTVVWPLRSSVHRTVHPVKRDLLGGDLMSVHQNNRVFGRRHGIPLPPNVLRFRTCVGFVPSTYPFQNTSEGVLDLHLLFGGVSSRGVPTNRRK